MSGHFFQETEEDRELTKKVYEYHTESYYFMSNCNEKQEVWEQLINVYPDGKPKFSEDSRANSSTDNFTDFYNQHFGEHRLDGYLVDQENLNNTLNERKNFFEWYLLNQIFHKF